jgi:hypothetical protein
MPHTMPGPTLSNIPLASMTTAHGLDGPVAMQRMCMSDALLEYLFADEIFACDESRLGDCGFVSCCDHPRVPGHKYWEGYFHGRPEHRPFRSINPRKGNTFDKPAAPLRLRAFLAACRSANASWLEQVATADAVPDEFTALVKRGQAFGDMAVQVHHGDAIKDDDVSYHVDGINSCLHLALSLRGTRTLHCRLGAAPVTHFNDLSHRAYTFAAGDVYLSSPSAFPHGVEYPTASWDTRVVAVQCRLLFTREQQARLEAEHPERLAALRAAVTEAITSAAFRVPTLPEVEAEAARMKQQDVRAGRWSAREWLLGRWRACE